MNTISIMHKDHEVIVPLTNSSKTVTLDAADYNALMAMEISPRWKLSQAGKVMVGNNKTIARLITEAQRGQQVKYADGDPTNLRRSNLILTDYSQRLVSLNHIFEDREKDQGKTTTPVSGEGGLERAI
jgi:hypothetical protein